MISNCDGASNREEKFQSTGLMVRDTTGNGEKEKDLPHDHPHPQHTQLYQFLNLNLFVSLKSGFRACCRRDSFFLAEFLILISIQHF